MDTEQQQWERQYIGTDTNDQDCPRCQGTGTIWEYVVEDGERFYVGPGICPTCRGKGWLPK